MKRILLCFTLSLISIIAISQEAKIERINILAGKNPIVIDAAYNKLSSQDTYALTSNLNQSAPASFFGSYLDRGCGTQVNANQNPMYVFEFEFSPINRPKIAYVTISELTGKRRVDQNYVAVVDFETSCKLLVKDNRGEVLKSIIISNGLDVKRYYYCFATSNKNPNGLLLEKINERDIMGWATPELLALRMKEAEKGNIFGDIYSQIISEYYRKAHAVLMVLFDDISVSQSNFKMHTIKKKQQSSFPQAMESVEELRSCFTAWVDNPNDEANLSIMRMCSDKAALYAQNSNDRKLQILYYMNAALGYTLLGDYSSAAQCAIKGDDLDRSFFQTAADAESYFYSLLRRRDIYRVSREINANQSFDFKSN